MKKRWNLRNQLLIYISSLIIIISVLIASVSFKMCNEIIVDQIGQSRVDVLKQIGERTSNVKESMIYISNTLFFNSRLKHLMMEEDSNSKQSFKETFDGLIENINSAFQSTNFLFEVECICESGLYYNTDHYMNDFSEIKNELWYKELLKNPNEVLWISSTIGQVINYDSTVSAVSAVTNAAEKIVAVIIVSVNETQFSDKYENIIYKDNEIFIVDGNGKIVSSNNKI